MEWIIGMILMAFFVFGPILSIGIFILIAFFTLKLLGGMFGGGGYGGGMSSSGPFPHAGLGTSSGFRELYQLDRIRREQSEISQASMKSNAAQVGIFLDD